MGYPLNCLFTSIWFQVTTLYNRSRIIFLKFCLYILVEHFIWHIVNKKIQISLNIFFVFSYFLNIFHISFIQTQHSKDMRMYCTIPTLESYSHQLSPWDALHNPSNILSPVQCSFWYHVMKSSLQIEVFIFSILSSHFIYGIHTIHYKQLWE